MQDVEFERFVRSTQDKALRLAHSYLGDWEEARDAVQEAFVKAYRKAVRFRGDSSIGTWYFRILVNHCRDRLRRRKVRAWLTLGEDHDETDRLGNHPDPRPNPETHAEQRAFRRALGSAVAKLPRRQREVFRMKAQAGMTLAETATALGISGGAAKSHLFRATRALQEALAHWKDAR